MTLSFIYPIFNRAQLFRRTLDSFVLQHGRDEIEFEILVVDDGSTEDILGLVREYGEHAVAAWRLPIRYFRIETAALEATPPIARAADGSNNSAIAINVGIRQARGTHVILSSPEIKHIASTNLSRLATWPLSESTALVADVYDRDWANTEYGGWVCGGPKRRTLHFLVQYPRHLLFKIGGMDERFMAGHAFDDNELCDRWLRNGYDYAFTGEAVVAEHQPHPRVYLPDGVSSNGALYERTLREKPTVANTDHEWGDGAVIVETWPG